MMQHQRPYVLSIAGFDPSAGAGILADCKTFEQHKVYGLGVCSALTVQNDRAFFSIQWLSARQIMEQLQPLSFNIIACKIGIIESLQTLLEITSFLKHRNPSIKIVWDPVLKASAGYSFHHKIAVHQLEQVLSSIDLITPNFNEWQHLQAISSNAFPCAVLLKGGHRPDETGVDTLYENGREITIPNGIKKASPKHGSGCVLSAAITAQLALGLSLQQACAKSKQYIETFLNSNESLLGYHHLC
jgi:Hydroxymethylpyrimidine/phosphomethylpyrimidine kinase